MWYLWTSTINHANNVLYKSWEISGDAVVLSMKHCIEDNRFKKNLDLFISSFVVSSHGPKLIVYDSYVICFFSQKVRIYFLTRTEIQRD